MFPGLGGVNPAQMKAMMRQMGIKTEDFSARRVVIELEGKKIFIENPNVQKIDMRGEVSWQIVGDAREEVEKEGLSEEDVELVMEKTGKGEAEVRKVLEETGDIAEAIVQLGR